MKRVVITGIGILSSIGNNKKEVLTSLLQLKSGIVWSKEFKDIGMKSHICGNIKLDTTGIIDKKKSRFMNTASIYAYLAMEEAIADSKLTNMMISNNRTGLIVGSGAESTVKISNIMCSKQLRKLGPYMVIKSMPSSVSACLSTFFKIKGITYSISSACTTSAHCIINAVEIIQCGKQDIIFAGGSEELCWELACKFDAMKALSTHYNDHPLKASRAYDVNRDGFVIAEGSGIVVIEELEHALARNAYIYAEIIGYGITSDGYNMVIPSGEGAIRCMKLALMNISNSIDYINVHGTSTLIGDIIELKSIRHTFINYSPAFSSTKSITGHSLGAAGVHEVIFSLLMLIYNFIVPSINIEILDSNAIGLNLITKLVKRKLTTVMSNNFGFGGTNASLIMHKYYY